MLFQVRLRSAKPGTCRRGSRGITGASPPRSDFGTILLHWATAFALVVPVHGLADCNLRLRLPQPHAGDVADLAPRRDVDLALLRRSRPVLLRLCLPALHFT